MTRRILTFGLAALGLLGALAAGGAAVAADAPSDQVASLREGNRLYREGRLEEARDAYLAGYRPEAPHPVLEYNMATTMHHLGDLPQAILWYRRAEATNPGDPWMRENLRRARASLGLQPYDAPGMSGMVSRHATLLFYLAAALAWLGAALFIARPRRSGVAAAGLVTLGALLYALTWAADRSAPRAAVVLEGCSAASGDLPAGSEIWVTGQSDGQVEIAAGRATLVCPRESVSLVSRGG